MEFTNKQKEILAAAGCEVCTNEWGDQIAVVPQLPEDKERFVFKGEIVTIDPVYPISADRVRSNRAWGKDRSATFWKAQELVSRLWEY